MSDSPEERLNVQHCDDTLPEPDPVSEQPADPIESAAMLFRLYFPRFSRDLDTLPAKSLRRLIRAWIGVPLEEVSPNLKRPEEKAAYAIGDRLLQAKTVVTLHTLYQHAEELQAAENAPQQPTAT